MHTLQIDIDIESRPIYLRREQESIDSSPKAIEQLRKECQKIHPQKNMHKTHDYAMGYIMLQVKFVIEEQ